MQTAKVIGQTKSVGFEIGARKTFPVSVESAWDSLFSNEGLAIWLGKIKTGDIELNRAYQTEDGIEGKVNVLKPYSHIRVTYKKNDWENPSLVQVRVIPSKEKSTISFHQEKLLNSIQREEMRNHWSSILDRIETKLRH